MHAQPADPSRVRAATVGDEDDLLSLCRELYDENGVHHFGFSEDKVRAAIELALRPSNMPRVIGVVGARNRIEGAIYLEAAQQWYGEGWCLSEVFNFVRQPFRASTNAKDLIAFAKVFAETLTIPLMIGVLSNERTIEKIRFYRRQLGEPAGAFWLTGATTGKVA